MTLRSPNRIIGVVLWSMLAAGCASLPVAGQVVDLDVDAQSPPGFSLKPPSVRLVGSDLMVRGALCRRPLSMGAAPSTLRLSINGTPLAETATRLVAAPLLPTRRGPRCGFYSARLPAAQGMASLTIKAAP